MAAAVPQAWRWSRVHDVVVSEGVELVPAENKTGFKGVRCKDGKYHVEVTDSGRKFHVGTFATPEEGARAYAHARFS